MGYKPLRDPQAFSLTEGGPFHRLLIRLHVRQPGIKSRYWWLAIALWLPIAVGEGVRVALGRPFDPMLSDLSLHARLLFTFPILLIAEGLLETTSRSAVTSLYAGEFCDRDDLDRIFARAERLRDSWRVELLLLLVAILGGQLVLWRVFGATGLFHGGAEVGTWTFPRVWYASLALPVVQFAMFRWLWRWAIWSYVIVLVSRLPLFVLATHADQAGGLAGLARPVTGFSGFVLAIAAILAAAWGTQVLEGYTTVGALLPMLAGFLLTALLVAVGPLLIVSGHLFRARRRTLAGYGDFVRRYVLAFHHKWIDRPGSPDALGSPDIQSLNDLGEAFQVIAKTRVFVFGPRNVMTVWFAGLIPMLPLFASMLTVEQVLETIVSTVLGGIPI